MLPPVIVSDFAASRALEVPHGEKWWRYGYEFVFVQCLLMNMVLLTLAAVFGLLASAARAMETTDFQRRMAQLHRFLLANEQTVMVPGIIRAPNDV